MSNNWCASTTSVILEIDEDHIVVEKPDTRPTRRRCSLLQPDGVAAYSVRSGTVAIIKSRRELLNEYLEEIERLNNKQHN